MRGDEEEEAGTEKTVVEPKPFHDPAHKVRRSSGRHHQAHRALAKFVEAEYESLDDFLAAQAPSGIHPHQMSGCDGSKKILELWVGRTRTSLASSSGAPTV